ncbi:hypothetical protein PTKIN_Ptkin12aG0164100 [Pterospermum kingtungense]
MDRNRKWAATRGFRPALRKQIRNPSRPLICKTLSLLTLGNKFDSLQAPVTRIYDLIQTQGRCWTLLALLLLILKELDHLTNKSKSKQSEPRHLRKSKQASKSLVSLSFLRLLSHGSHIQQPTETPHCTTKATPSTIQAASSFEPHKLIISDESINQPKLFSETIHHLQSASLPLTTLALPFFLDTKDVLAVNGEFGFLEGRSVALMHPIVMGGLFFNTLWAGYLGWQWRRVRTIQDEINELKKQVKPAPVTPEGKPVEAAPSPAELKIQQLTEERKELLKGSYRDRHFNAGSILLGFGVLESVSGGLNTWTRTGKLFPGPHLFAEADSGEENIEQAKFGEVVQRPKRERKAYVRLKDYMLKY